MAVTDLPRSLGPWTRSSADERVSRLLYLPVLASDEEDSTRGGGPGQLAAGLETVDLGRRLNLRIRQDLTWSDGSRPVSAIDVTRALTERTVPTSPGYNARWADLLDRVESPDVTRVEIRLTRPHLRPAAWLIAPVGPAHAGPDGWVATLDQGRQLVGDGPFRLVSASKGQLRLRTSGDERSPGSLRVRRLHEVRLPSASAAIGALVRGEVSLVEHIPADRVASLAADPEIKVGRFTRPYLHRIALDGRTLSLRNRTLRRGLSYAIDRKSLLEETLLRRPSDANNAVADGPFPKGSYADAADVKPLGYDPLLAKMLIAAARKELGGAAIKLTLDYPATSGGASRRPEDRRCAPARGSGDRRGRAPRGGTGSGTASRASIRPGVSLVAVRRARTGCRPADLSRVTTHLPRPMRSVRWPAPGSCNCSCNWSGRRNGPRHARRSSRSTARAATSCRSSPSGNWRAIMPGGRG